MCVYINIFVKLKFISRKCYISKDKQSLTFFIFLKALASIDTDKDVSMWSLNQKKFGKENTVSKRVPSL